MKSKRIRDWVRNKSRNKTTPQASASGTSGYVYVVHLGIENLYKIGRSGNMVARLKDLAASNPRLTATLACRVGNMYRVEGVLHRRFKRQRISRECYGLEPGDLERIRTFLDKNSSANRVSKRHPGEL